MTDSKQDHQVETKSVVPQLSDIKDHPKQPLDDHQHDKNSCNSRLWGPQYEKLLISPQCDKNQPKCAAHSAILFTADQSKGVIGFYQRKGDSCKSLCEDAIQTISVSDMCPQIVLEDGSKATVKANEIHLDGTIVNRVFNDLVSTAGSLGADVGDLETKVDSLRTDLDSLLEETIDPLKTRIKYDGSDDDFYPYGKDPILAFSDSSGGSCWAPRVDSRVGIRADEIYLHGKIVNDGFTDLCNTTSDLKDRTETLEEENRDLKDENQNLKDELEALSSKCGTLGERVERLESLIEEMFKYSPNQEGYETAKSDFESRQ